MKNLSIIIPVYNEEKIIRENTKKLIQFLNNSEVEYEILIVDNGSTDTTKEKGEGLERKFPQVRFFHSGRRGVGLAFRKAVEEAKYENLISLDMDLSVDLSFIPMGLKLLETNNLVVGSKKLGAQKRSLFRKFASQGFIFLVKLFLGLNFHDYSIAAKGYRKKDIRKWMKEIDHGSSYVIELIYFTQLNGKKIKEIPVYCHDTRKSKFNLWGEIFYRFKNLINFWWREKVKK